MWVGKYEIGNDKYVCVKIIQSRCELGAFWKLSCRNISQLALIIVSSPGGLSSSSEDKSRHVSESAPRDSVVILVFTTQ